MRFLLAIVLASLLSLPAQAAGTFSGLPDATEPLGGTNEFAPMDQGAGCPTGSPCVTVKAPPVRFGQPLQTTCSTVAAPFLFEQCIDTSLTPRILKIWLGTQWVALETYDTTNQVAFPGSVRTVSGNTTISSTDCGNEVDLGGNIQAVFTVPVASSVPVNCKIKIVNTDDAPTAGGHGKSPAGITLPTAFLYPGPNNQSVTITSNGTKWVLSQYENRWKSPTGTTFAYVSPSTGSNSNDGLSTATPLRDVNRAMAQFYNDLDLSGTLSRSAIQFQMLGSSIDNSSGCVNFGPTAPVGGTTSIALILDGGGFTLTCTGAATLAFGTKATLIVQNVVLQSDTDCLVASNEADLFVEVGVHFGGAHPGGGGLGCGSVAIDAIDNAIVRLTNNYDFDGPYQFHWAASGAGAQILAVSPITISGTTETITDFASAVNGGLIDVAGVTVSATSATGTRCVAAYNGVVLTKTGNSDTDLPGTVPSVVLSGGQCNSQNWAPTASPAFTGIPTAPTAARNDTSTQLATDAFVTNQASAVADGLPQMDGAAARGVSLAYARADHVHPSDTNRAAFVAPQAFSMADSSGASLTLTSVNVQYSQVGNDVHIYGSITYPTNASGSNSQVSLPIACPNVTYSPAPGSVIGAGSGISAVIQCIAGTSNAQFSSSASGSRITNSTLTGANLIFNLWYPKI